MCIVYVVYGDTFKSALFRLLVISLTVVLGVFFFTAVTMLPSSAVVFLGRPVLCMLLSTPMISFFFNAFSPINSSLVSTLLYIFLTTMLNTHKHITKTKIGHLKLTGHITLGVTYIIIFMCHVLYYSYLCYIGVFDVMDDVILQHRGTYN